MIGLSKVDELDGQLLVGHDVGGLEVEVGDLILGEVSEALGDHDGEVDFGLKGHGFLVPLAVIIQVGVVDVIREQVVLEITVVVCQQVVLVQEDGYPILDLG